MFHRHNTDILNYDFSIYLPVKSILKELILCIAPTAGQYSKILPSRLSNAGELKFNIIRLSNWECTILYCIILYCTMLPMNWTRSTLKNYLKRGPTDGHRNSMKELAKEPILWKSRILDTLNLPTNADSSTNPFFLFFFFYQKFLFEGIQERKGHLILDRV